MATDQQSVAGRDVVAPASQRATLRIPGSPPSFNAIGYRSHWAVGQRAKKQWQEWLSIALMEQGVPRGLESVRATATIRFKQRRRRDSGNFRVILEKALGDALVEGGWLADDTASQYGFGDLTLFAPVPQPETIVVLDYER
jgi:hypothetical protein